MTDLTYIESGLFTQFIAETKDGEGVWNQIALAMGGNAKVLTMHKKQVLAQIRKAGYSVKKASKSKLTLEQIIKEDDELLEVLGV